MAGQIAHKGEKAPLQAGQRWPVERTNAWHNAFGLLQRCYERREEVIDVASRVRNGPTCGRVRAPPVDLWHTGRA